MNRGISVSLNVNIMKFEFFKTGKLVQKPGLRQVYEHYMNKRIMRPGIQQGGSVIASQMPKYLVLSAHETLESQRWRT